MEPDWEKTDREIRWTGAGSSMSATEAAAAEGRLLVEPDILELRIKLLGYYFLKALKSRAARDSRYKHICWMIKNHPDHFVASEPYVQINDRHYSTRLFAKARELWLEQIYQRPANSSIYGNFGLFIIDRDLDSGLEMLQRAHQLEIDKNNWSSFIILFCSFQAKPGPLAKYRRKYAELALTYAKAATDYDSEYLGNKIAAFEYLTKCALYLNKFELAAEYAASYTATMKAWGHKDTAYQKNVLGIIAARQGNVTVASSYLLDVHPGEERYFQMVGLAQELLSYNQHAVVAEFLRRTLKLGPLDDKEIKHWRYWLEEVEKESSPLIGNFRVKPKSKKRSRRK